MLITEPIKRRTLTLCQLIKVVSPTNKIHVRKLESKIILKYNKDKDL